MSWIWLSEYCPSGIKIALSPVSFEIIQMLLSQNVGFGTNMVLLYAKNHHFNVLKVTLERARARTANTDRVRRSYSCVETITKQDDRCKDVKM